MPNFEVVSPFQPSGDQPEAIEALARGVELGLDEQTLLGVTGSGKTYTMAKVIEKVQRPTLVLAHNIGRDHIGAGAAPHLHDALAGKQLHLPDYPRTTWCRRGRDRWSVPRCRA